jgi:hypothetical protein
MTIRMFKAVLAGSAMLALGLSANVAQAATATANAKAQILKALTVTKTTDLDFGTIVAGTAIGTVTLPTTGAASCTGTITCAGTPVPALFAVTGTTGQIVTIAAANTTLSGPGTAMAATLAPSSATLTLSGVAATDVFKVGGALIVGASQLEGVYTGSFGVTVNYQ